MTVTRPGTRGILAVVAGSALAIAMALPAAAPAVVSNVRLIDGPSSALTGDVDVAMSEDGSGGVVYLKRVEDHEHVFAVGFQDGEWGSPQRVDIGQRFDSSWPRIAAGDEGRLLVTWVQDFGVQTDRMFSATMDPGAQGFRDPVPVDFDIGKATSTFPDLAMARGGQAYLIYCVVTDRSTSNPTGYVGLDVRLARYSNRLWSSVGQRIDRNSSIPMRIPTSATAPRIGMDVQGQAVAAWLEPDDDFINRVWARRVFGSSTGIPLQVSPGTWEEKPLRGSVTGFSLDVAGFGQAFVAFNQQPGQSSSLGGPRIMVNGMPDIFTEGADDFGDPQIADGQLREGEGTPSIAVDPVGIFASAFSSGQATLFSTGDEFSIYGVERIDEAASTVDGSPQVDVAQSGAGVVAWRELRSTGGILSVQERRADGVVESTALSAPRGGALGPPAMGGSGLGDALIAFSQGTGSGRQIAATVVNAPPDPFLVLVPSGWRNERQVRIAWDPAPNAIGDVTYSVSVDDEPVADGVEGERTKLSPRQIEDGNHRVQIYAVDSAGQETGSLKGRVSVDRTAPKVRVKSRRGRVEVEIDDGRRNQSSGLSGGEIEFGDGTKARATARAGAVARETHRFDREGTYRVRVKARDEAGNPVEKKVKVRVR